MAGSLDPSAETGRPDARAVRVRRFAWLLDAAIMLAVTAIALLIGEGLVRWLHGDRIVLFPRNHAAAVYGDYTLRSMTPNSVFWHESIDGRWRFQTNNAGFRDARDYLHAKPAGVLRVLVLGDSHTAGFEVHQDETYSAMLGRKLRSMGIVAEVLNAGVSGLGTAEQLAFFEQEGWKYSPDVVVVGFFGNDFTDNIRSSLFRLEGGGLVATGKVYAPAVGVIRLVNAIPGLKWASENSYLYSLAFNTVWELVKSRAARTSRSEEAVRTGAVTNDEMALASALLQRLAAFAHAKGAKVILADVPEVAADREPRSSLSPEFRARVAASFDKTLWQEAWLAGRLQGQSAHLPNGHRHINADSHRRLAEGLADVIDRWRVRQ